MPYYVASVNIVVQAPDAESANEYLGCELSSLRFRKSEPFGVLDWQYRQVGGNSRSKNPYAYPKPIKIKSPYDPQYGFDVFEW
jgi:hypothetical protein